MKNAQSEGLRDLDSWVAANRPGDLDQHPAWMHGAHLRLRGSARPSSWPRAEQGWRAMDAALAAKMRFRCSVCAAIHPPEASELAVEGDLGSADAPEAD